jgi:predicted RNase H-like HicB family nuclease
MAIETIQSTMPAQAKKIPPDLRQVRRCPHCGDLMFRKPVIACGHCGRVMPLRCYAYKSGAKYYAECLSLNLISRGETQEEAVGRLQEAMFLHVNTAFDGDTKGLIPRRAPLLRWLRYWAHAFAEWITTYKNHRRHGADDLNDLGVTTLSHC